MKKHYYGWNDIESAVDNIILQMYNDMWRPDYIVGITRGGNVPATILSNRLNIRCEALKVKLRDNKDSEGSESNWWMSEEAFGINDETKTGVTGARWDIKLRKNILIVDDINDTGATFNWIKKDWQASCMPNEESAWDSVWNDNGNVRFATITENLASEFDLVKYYHHEVNKVEEDVWLVYPWENNNWRENNG
jgi:hypoxanthine phosphoribosyltransferase